MSGYDSFIENLQKAVAAAGGIAEKQRDAFQSSLIDPPWKFTLNFAGEETSGWLLAANMRPNFRASNQKIRGENGVIPHQTVDLSQESESTDLRQKVIDTTKTALQSGSVMLMSMWHGNSLPNDAYPDQYQDPERYMTPGTYMYLGKSKDIKNAKGKPTEYRMNISELGELSGQAGNPLHIFTYQCVGADIKALQMNTFAVGSVYMGLDYAPTQDKDHAAPVRKLAADGLDVSTPMDLMTHYYTSSNVSWQRPVIAIKSSTSNSTVIDLTDYVINLKGQIDDGFVGIVTPKLKAMGVSDSEIKNALSDIQRGKVNVGMDVPLMGSNHNIELAVASAYVSHLYEKGPYAVEQYFQARQGQDKGKDYDGKPYHVQYVYSPEDIRKFHPQLFPGSGQPQRSNER